jgi:hypothetical protein
MLRLPAAIGNRLEMDAIPSFSSIVVGKMALSR